jgi:hypothetical protein
MNTRSVRLLMAVILSMMPLLTRADDECPVRVGEFSGRVKAEWLTKSREMRLLEDFAFKGPDCRVWPVPKGAVVHGASIPRVLWSVAGGPFDGAYRDGSVVHDYYCKVKTAPSDDVHEMFYHALLASGVDSVTAGVMFYAVSWFGPRWQVMKRISVNNEFSAFVLVREKSFSLPTYVADQVATAVGQPSPSAVDLLSVREFRAQPEIYGDFLAKWLKVNDTFVVRPKELPPIEAFHKAARTELSPAFSSNGEAFRIYSPGPASPEPSSSDVARIRSWIEKARPTLAQLRGTPPRSVP